MESRLLYAAEQLPQPERNFASIEDIYARKTKSKQNPRLRRVIMAAVLIICLCSTVLAYGEIKYGLWSGIHSYGYGDVVLLNWKYDYTFPEEFLGLAFSNMSTCYGAPEGATHLQALLNPTYALHSVSYGDYSGIAQEDGSTLWTGEEIRISFGTTKTDTWKYHFSVGEYGSCDNEEVTPGSQWKTEYEGYTLYVYSIGDRHHVRWEDTDRNLVLVIRCVGAKTQDEVIETAKALIDLNQ